MPRGRPGATEEGFCVSILALMASEGFLPVSRVTSSFRAATTKGNRSVDRSHLLGLLVPEEAFSQCPVEALHDALVPVDVHPTAPNLDRVLRQQVTDGAHELLPRVNLTELWPPQGAPFVNPSKANGDLCRSLVSQGLSLFVAAGDVNDHESIAEGFPSYTVVWQKEQVGLVDLVWHRHVKLWPWYVP